MVNRVWLYHFGAGLVATPSDFGLRSDPPTHPELLDCLAAEFVDERLVGQGAAPADHALEHLPAAERPTATTASPTDPQNRLLWKFNRRRLDFEAMRDALLAVSGPLDPTMGGRPVADRRRRRSRRGGRSTASSTARTSTAVYRTFDFASPDASSPRRLVTTVPQQALFLMNSPFVHRPGPRASPGRPEPTVGRPEPTASGGSTAASSAATPEPDELALGRRVPPTARPARRRGRRPDAARRPGKSTPRSLLLTNEFVFVD